MSKDCAVEKSTLTAETSLPPVCAATSDASTVLMESDSDAAWSRTESDVDADGTNTGPGTEVRNALGGGTPSVGNAPDQQCTSSSPPSPEESPALAPFKSAQYSPVDEISSPGSVATAPPAIEMITHCDSAEEFALVKACAPGAKTANEEDVGSAEIDQPADAGVDLPECEVRSLNPFEEEPFNPFEEDSLNPSLAPLRHRVSEAVSLEDSLVFPSLQDTMASLERSATPSKTHSMNLPSPHNMECTKKPDNNSGMCSAPATVADIPLLLTESSFSPAPDSQESELPPLRASNSSKSWEGFDIIDAAQMELASIIKETRCQKHI